MKPSAHIQVIVNPSSGARKTLRNLPSIISRIERLFPGECTFSLTAGPGDALRLAAAAVRAHSALIIVVGGDGTVHEAVNGMLEATGGGLPTTPLGVIASGSGQGFALSLRLPRTLDEQVSVIRDSPSRAIDVGRISVGGPGGMRERYFVNECQVGIGADVVLRTRSVRKSAGGLLAYGTATFAALFRSPNARLCVTCDDGESDPAQILGLSFGNGDRTGGGMALTPGAKLDDGFLNLLTIRGQTLRERIRSFPKIYAGTHTGAREFSYRTLRRCEVTGPAEIAVAADGEMIGHLPCRISTVSGAVLVSAPQDPGRIAR